MIALYVGILVVISALTWLVNTRTKSLEKKFIKINFNLQNMLALADSNHPNTLSRIRSEAKLHTITVQEQRVGDKLAWWTDLSEWLGRMLDRVVKMRGRTAPYLLGIVDSAGILAICEYMGVADRIRISTLSNVALQLYQQYLTILG